MIKKLNLKVVLITFSIITLGIFAGFKYTQTLTSRNIDNEMKSLVNKKVQAWITYYESNDRILMSSNPYAYLQNEKFEEIKNLGPEYMPYILKEIGENPAAVFALWEIKDISKAYNLPKWDSDDQCVSIWNQYVESFPEEFNKLKKELYSETDPKKIKLKSQEIKDLGYLALPFIVEENNERMDTIAKQLFRDNINQVSYSESNMNSPQSENTTIEEKIDSKLKNYKALVELNKNIGSLNKFKINIKYK